MKTRQMRMTLEELERTPQREWTAERNPWMKDVGRVPGALVSEGPPPQFFLTDAIRCLENLGMDAAWEHYYKRHPEARPVST